MEGRDYKLNEHILPEFGDKRIDEIQSIDILNYLDSLEKDGIRLDGRSGGYSSSTINHHYQALKDIFDRAVDWKFIKKSPVEGVKRPQVRYKKFKVYDEEKARMVFEKLLDAPVHWRIYFTLALTCGFRRGELLGLQEKHIDLANNKIHIDCQLRYTKENGFEFTAPKKDSFRTVSVSKYVIEELKSYIELKREERKQAAEPWEGGKYLLIFSTWNGKPFNTDVPRKWWKRFTERTKIPYIRPHDFRHTSASILINKGVHDEIVKERLGHSDIKMMNIYAHVFEQSDVAAASEYDSIFDNKNKNQ